MLLMMSMVKKLLEHFMKKNYKKTTNQQGFRIKKRLKEKDLIYMSNGKDMIINLIAGLRKKT